MRTQLLLPSKFKTPGIIVLIPAVLIAITVILLGRIPELLSIYVRTVTDGMPVKSNITGDIILVMLLLGAFLTGFSREKREDEAIMKQRQSALLWSVYINLALLLLGYFLLGYFVFAVFMLYGIFSIMLVYIILFNVILYRNSKKSGYE
ncbi:hypothetical protein BH11BAC4_BH11BAC4_22610 [soil metagenome]